MAQLPDLSVELAGIALRNPVIAASGTFGYGEEFAQFLDLNELGGICVKGTSARPIAGNPPPRLFPTASGMLNSIGLENVGVDRFVAEKMPFLRKVDCATIVNVFGFTEDDYLEVVDKLNACEGVAAYELNISCPNTECGGMVFGTSAAATQQLTRRVKDRARRPVVVKLSPNVTDIVEIARAAAAGGADALTIANTYLAMAVDPESFTPRIRMITAGLSGPAVKPITLRMVFQVTRALSIPVIGAGGISSGADAVEYMLAGATAIQVGTANFHDPRITVKIIKELKDFLQRRRLPSARALIGKMKQ
jgi:dihydroorotate dehydrogenase (NAD+) catalytic subunit